MFHLLNKILGNFSPFKKNPRKNPTPKRLSPTFSVAQASARLNTLDAATAPAAAVAPWEVAPWSISCVEGVLNYPGKRPQTVLRCFLVGNRGCQVRVRISASESCSTTSARHLSGFLHQQPLGPLVQDLCLRVSCPRSLCHDVCIRIR